MSRSVDASGAALTPRTLIGSRPRCSASCAYGLPARQAKLVTALGELRLGLTADAETTLEDAIAFFLGTHDELSETLRLELLRTVVDYGKEPV